MELETESVIEYLMQYGLDVKKRTIYLSDNYDAEGEDEINSASTEKLFKCLSVLENLSNDPITIILNTSGGNTDQGMAIYDLLSACSCKIKIKVVGNAHSMGAIILQSADERIMSRNSTILLHYGQTTIDAESDNIKRWQKEYERQEKVIEGIIYRKVRKKLTKKQLRDMMRFDTILDAEQSLKLGLVDKIEN
jgi:ATP-dependent Clp protease protease subunit